MNEQTISEEEITRQCKHAFDYFTNQKCLNQSKPPEATLLLSFGADVRSYYVMEGYTDNCIYLDIRELFRVFRPFIELKLSVGILDHLRQVGLDLAKFCFRSRYNLAIDLSGTNRENLDTVINALTSLGYQVQKVLIAPGENPYKDISPEDFNNLLPSSEWERLHTDWIRSAARKIIDEETEYPPIVLPESVN